MILVTGATGKTGGQTVKHLLTRGAPVRALVRNAEKAAPLAARGVELIVGDAGDGAAVAGALDGAEKLMLTLPNGPDQLEWEMGIVKQAEAAGVEHVAYLSSTESNPENPRRIPQVHVEVAAALKASNLGWTILRPNFFMQNMFMFAASVKANDSFTFPLGDGKVAMCDARDVGEVAALVLTGDGHLGKSYDLTGPELLSMHDAADTLSSIAGRAVAYVPEPIDDFRTRLRNVLASEWHVEGVVELMRETAEEGGLVQPTGTVEELLGRPPCSLARFLEEHKTMFER